MTSSTIAQPLSSLTVVIERITFHSEESGYTVARLNTGNVKQLTTIVGSFANIQAGQTLALIVGSEKAVAIAVRQVKQQQRYTRSRKRLEDKK